MPTKHPATTPANDPAFMAKVKPLFEKGLTYPEIAREIGSTRSTVAAFCRSNLVPNNHHRNIDHNQVKSETRRTVPNEKARRVLALVAAVSGSRGYPPTYREIADALNLSVAGAFYQIRILKDYGWLTKTPGISRTVALTSEGRSALLAK